MFKSISLVHLLILSTVVLSGCHFLGTTSSVSGTSPSPVVTADATGQSPKPTTPSTGGAIAQTPTPNQPRPTQPDIANPIFTEVVPELTAETNVPVVLPTYVPNDGQSPVYAVLESATPSQYSVILGYSEDCQGGTACRLGTVTAESATSTPLAGEKVGLVNGVTGYFTEATCGANCSDATLSWEQNGNRYTVGIKAGEVETLVKMANSAIEQ